MATGTLYGKWMGLAIGLAGISIINGLLHTMMFMIYWIYNPGLMSGLFLLIPFGLHLSFTLLKDAPLEQISSGLVIFAIGASLIPVSIFLTNKWKKSVKS